MSIPIVSACVFSYDMKRTVCMQYSTQTVLLLIIDSKSLKIKDQLFLFLEITSTVTAPRSTAPFTIF